MINRVHTAAKILNDNEVDSYVKAKKSIILNSSKYSKKEADTLFKEFEKRIRFRPIATRCYLARKRRNLSLKDISTELDVPESKLKSIEIGLFPQVEVKVLYQYIKYLKLDYWFDHWKQKNNSPI
jgi:hypothetical protein